ncbi:MarR family transcriptional regulator [Desertihabitans brevis]|uniref:MarR family transcriptional regulator n=2 Tax=Desertihabitans brevis TaxID=2268447 RepID=A0A367Z1R2_9ACTN|nr:MarR family transcriptional regulator [Desertihabitans brevis]
MGQGGIGIELETSVGYALKEASSALRTAMEDVLRPLGMTVTHYSCLELLAQRPGLSNSDLARGTFVTRQAMNVLLQALERDGHVTRPDAAPVGRALPARLTPRGRRRLEEASTAVRAVEDRMLASLDDAEQTVILRALRRMTQSLHDTTGTEAPQQAATRKRATRSGLVEGQASGLGTASARATASLKGLSW